MASRACLLHRWRRGTRGLAALEFALLSPFLAVLIFGILELSLRFRAADEFHRFVQQTGDMLSREEELFSEDLDAVYAAAAEIMKPVSLAGGLEMDVASIGFTPDGSPEQLWQRARGGTAVPFDVTEAAGLGAPGESVLRVSARFRYATPLSDMLSLGPLEMGHAVYYRPRVTRLIAIDGEIHDGGAEWLNDGDSIAATGDVS